MENQEVKTKSLGANALLWGLIAGGANVLYSLLLYSLGLSFNKSLGWLVYLILIGIMIWGTKKWRDESSNGYMSYGKAYLSSFLIGIYSGIILSVFMYILYTVIAPELIDQMVAMQRAQMEAKSNLDQEQIDQALEMSKKFMSPGMMVFWVAIGSAIMSALISLLAALFVRKEEKIIV